MCLLFVSYCSVCADSLTLDDLKKAGCWETVGKNVDISVPQRNRPPKIEKAIETGWLSVAQNMQVFMAVTNNKPPFIVIQDDNFNFFISINKQNVANFGGVFTTKQGREIDFHIVSWREWRIPREWLEYWNQQAELKSNVRQQSSRFTDRAPESVLAAKASFPVDYSIDHRSNFEMISLGDLTLQYQQAEKHGGGRVVFFHGYGIDISEISAELARIGSSAVGIASTSTTLEGAGLFAFNEKDEKFNDLEGELEKGVQGEHACYATLEATIARYNASLKNPLIRENNEFQPVLFSSFDRSQKRQDLKIGIYHDVPVTRTCTGRPKDNNFESKKLTPPFKKITQFVLAAKNLNERYLKHEPTEKQKNDAKIIIKGMIRAAIYAAKINNNKVLFLPLLGAGAFQNESLWTIEALTDMGHELLDCGVLIVLHFYSGDTGDRLENKFREWIGSLTELHQEAPEFKKIEHKDSKSDLQNLVRLIENEVLKK